MASNEYYFSINQLPPNGPYAGPYYYAYGLGGPNPGVPPASAIPNPPLFAPPYPQGISGVLKINASNFSINNAVVAQCYYDSLNIADGSENVSISGQFSPPSLGPAGQRSITIKGNCKNITVSGVINQKGTSWFDGDVSIDDHIDQTKLPSSGINLSGLSAPFGKIKVVIRLFSTKNVTLGPNCKIDYVASAFRAIYCFFTNL